MISREKRKIYNKLYVEKNKERLIAYRKDKYTGLYGSWYAMKQRCGNTNNISYKNYGGRDINYPNKWENFEGFKEDMHSSYKDGLTLERINNNQSYSIKNCRWATRKEQNKNKRCNIVVEYASKKATLLQWWSDLEMQISYSTLRQRYYNGMSVEKMLETDLYRSRKLPQ